MGATIVWETEDEIRFLDGLGHWSKKGAHLLENGTEDAFMAHRIALVAGYLEAMDKRDPLKWARVNPKVVWAHGVNLLERLEAGEFVPLPSAEDE